MKVPTALIILDGYGLAPDSDSNAICHADTPVLDNLYETCPFTRLKASGEDVGLPAGQIGNSEVGHTNIGAGRVVFQELPLISREIADGKFFENEVLCGATDNTRQSGGALHLMGLLSDGGVHSHITHLYGLLELAKRHGVGRVYIHCFMDGRDVIPTSGIEYIRQLQTKCAERGVGKIATVSGRYYAMDRDSRWERLEKAYAALVYGQGEQNSDPADAVQKSYSAGVTDEFIVPVVCDKEGMIKAGDSVIFFDFRPDRARELTRALVDPDFTGFERKNGFFELYYVCMTQYDEHMPNVRVAYPPELLKNTFGEIISRLG
ncbi:MAG: 2,3-bisphosphoglycerate-independent phosphoglycerate mutase, partial [Oscillospiraceae bacterium]|nr:2,3-bisphosphoglycerate-independent phosphoglycerate mutase [Oscillospiraceae bacterium]